MNIIVVDDEKRALSLLEKAIRKALPGEEPVFFSAPDEALRFARKTRVDIAFLDIEMPEMNGLALAKALAGLNKRVNIIFITGYSEYMDAAFDMYASGYVKKPVEAERIQREMEHLRFPPENALPGEELRTLGPYTFDHLARRVYLNGRDTLLKPKEYALFCLFAKNTGVYFTADKLFREIWGNEPHGNVHTVYVHISSLRQKLGMEKDALYNIEKKREAGYRLVQYFLT